MTKTPLKLGDVAEIEFLDHCEDGAIMAFKVWGRVKRVTRLEYEVAAWGHSNPAEAEKDDPNEKTFSIVRRAITRTRKLK